jgi:Arylsulfotransferase (ASST)
MHRGALGLVVSGISVIAGLCLPCPAAAAAPPVSVFPIPGARVASPRTQIVFRGVPVSQLGTILVSGSKSGPHTGRIESDSDGHGGSFLPTTPFTPSEAVTVRTTLNILGGSNGSFGFTIADQVGRYPPAHWPHVNRPSNHGDVWHFHSRKDIFPDAVVVDKHGPTAPGYIFVASQGGPVQVGPEILDSNGNVIWFKSMQGDDSAANVKVQTYRGQKVLTWWQGYVTGGLGWGEDVINNSSYQVTNVVKAANGLMADLHEFKITPWNTALITAAKPVHWDARSIGGSSHQLTIDAVVQEIDIPTGLVLFQWDSLDHVPVSDSYSHLPKGGGSSPFDYFHVNSVDADHDGSVIISGRNTWAAYKVDRASARTIWTLGGKRSSFKMLPGASFAFQHDVQVRSAHDWFITMFDDGAGPPVIHPSRGLKLFLDTKKMVAKSVGAEHHVPSLQSYIEGNYQQLPGGEDFLGWGQQPYFSEYNSHGQEVYDAHFKDSVASYRAYRYQWTGTPQTTPAVVGASHGNSSGIYVSWNGATNVASWRVEGGGTPNSLRTVASSPKHGFETAITFGRQTYVRVQALDRFGHVLSTSATVKVG